MKDTEDIQEASESLQCDSNEQKCQKELREDKHDALEPSAPPSSVQFFPRIANSNSTMPTSLSLSQDIPFSYYGDTSVWNSLITLSALGPLASKTTVASYSQAESQTKPSMNLTFAKKQPLPSLDPDSLLIGEGEDYFLSLFGESRRLTTTHSLHSSEEIKHLSVILEEVGKCTSSSLGDIEIAEVNVKGLFVKLINSSLDKEVDIGQHTLQQNVDGRAICMYQFLPHIPMQANTTVTVWAAAAEAQHRPPTDFVWKEQDRFKWSPDCTTILCKPNGEAVAWYTPIHWRQAWEKLETDIEFDRCSIMSPTLRSHMLRYATSTLMIRKDKQDPVRKDSSKCQTEQAPTSLRRENKIPPTLYPNSSPWCHSPGFPAHPYCPLIKPHNIDMTESTWQTPPESQSAKPNSTPGTKKKKKSTEKTRNLHQDINKHSIKYLKPPK